MQRNFGMGLLLVGLVLYSYGLIWGSVDGFVRAIDHDEYLFSDFRRFYYPMGEGLFEERWPVGGYYYTSFFALGLSVVAFLPIGAAVYFWGVMQVGWVAVFYYVSGRWLLGISGRGMVFYLLLLLTSFPLLHNFKWGQVSVLVTLGIALAFVYHQQGRSVLGGVVLALVTGVKYYPGLFVVYFLIRRDWRLLIAFGAGLVGFYYLLPAALLGPSDWWYFERAAVDSLPGATLLLDDFNTQYFPHVINRLGFPLGYRLSESTVGILRFVGILVFLANSGIAWWLQQREVAHKVALSATVLLLSLPFIIQTSWPHYFVYLPFCQVALWLEISAAKTSIWTLRLLRMPLLFSVVITNAYFFALLPSWRLYNGMGLLWLGDVALLCALYGLVVAFRKSDRPEGNLYIDTP
ncbi:MAG: glycosyltransferase family 87 protein [Candidatus Latescibacterota bacterium]|nr:glycosyltransferase family 87 protein [Candidatus Latescibacterota bacterium]